MEVGRNCLSRIRDDGPQSGPLSWRWRSRRDRDTRDGTLHYATSARRVDACGAEAAVSGATAGTRLDSCHGNKTLELSSVTVR